MNTVKTHASCGNPCGMLMNMATGRFHPIIFRYAPPPSGDCSNAGRYKSIGHHTDGFDTMDAALAYVGEHPAWVWTGITWQWNGEGIPAMVEWFATRVEWFAPPETPEPIAAPDPSEQDS